MARYRERTSSYDGVNVSDEGKETSNLKHLCLFY